MGGAALPALRLEQTLSWALAPEALAPILKQNCDPSALSLIICHPERRTSVREADGYQVEGPCVFPKAAQTLRGVLTQPAARNHTEHNRVHKFSIEMEQNF
jgi:hypothetical protein